MAAEEPSTSGRPAKLDQTSATGDGCIFYPSGNIAVVVCKQEAGHIITFFTDSQSSQVRETDASMVAYHAKYDATVQAERSDAGFI